MNMDKYPVRAVALAESRGFDRAAHEAALAADPIGGSDDVALTHPTNWLTEDEVTEMWDAPGWVYPDGAAQRDLARG